MFKRVLACVMSAGLALVLSAGSALGASTLDQSQIMATHGSIGWGASDPTAQTFTPAHTGYLDKVSIYAAAYSSGSGISNQQVVTIEATSGGLPTGSTYASKTITVVDGWNDITLDTPVSVRAGVVYAIVVTATAQYNPYYTCDAGLYTRGQALVQDTSWKTVPQYASDHTADAGVYCTTDFAFRAYITPDNLGVVFTVTPTTGTPGATGAMTVSISVTNAGTLPTSNHVVLSDIGDVHHLIPFSATTSGCVPAVCVEGIQVDMGVIAAGDTVTWSGVGTYNLTGVAAGTTFSDTLETCVTDSVVAPTIARARFGPNASGVLQANGCWDATVQFVAGNQAPASTPTPTLHVTLPPTSAAPSGSGGGASTPSLALVLLAMALSATFLVATAGARRR